MIMLYQTITIDIKVNDNKMVKNAASYRAATDLEFIRLGGK